jgi:hypothetical protein
MHKAYARLQLWVARQPLFDAWHPNQHQPDLTSVIDVAHLLYPRHFQAASPIDEDQLDLEIGSNLLQMA